MKKFELNLHIFEQKEIPLLDGKGSAPDGNGGLFEYFWDSNPNWDVDFITTVVVDNLLADPFDARLVGHTAIHEADVTIKVVERISVEEKVGVVVEREEGIRVVEYCHQELDLSHRWANLSLFCVKSSFSKKVRALPLHVVKNGTKRERFIFDMLPLAKRVEILPYPRNVCFAPLKDLGDVETVRGSLQLRDRLRWKELTGVEADQRPFELSQDFYYTKDSFCGAKFPEKSYITLSDIVLDH